MLQNENSFCELGEKVPKKRVNKTSYNFIGKTSRKLAGEGIAGLQVPSAFRASFPFRSFLALPRHFLVLVGVYTRLFDYVNLRLPLSTFLVNVLRYYHIHISQLSVIAAAKVSHFEVLCCVHGFEPTVGLFRCFYVNSKNKGWMSFSKRPENDVVCYTKPLDSLKGWNDRFFWVDSFACPASFTWNTSKSLPKDPVPKAFAFNADHYATLVAHPAPFHKYPEPFLCLVGISRYYTLDENAYPVFLRADDEEMNLLSFIQTTNPMKVGIAKRERGVNEPALLETTVGRVVSLLPVAPARSSSEQAEQGDSAGVGHGRGVDVQPITVTNDTDVEDVASLQPRHQKKRKSVAADAIGPSHPPKNSKEDHGAQGELSVAGKSRSAVQRLLAGAVLNAEAKGDLFPLYPLSRPPYLPHQSVPTRALLTLPLVLAFKLLVLHKVTTDVTPAVDPTAGVKGKFVGPSAFGDGSSFGADRTVGGFSNPTGSDFIVGGIRTIVSPKIDLQKVYMPQWSVTNGACFDDGRICREMVDKFAPPKFFASICGMDHEHLFIEFNVRAARQMSLSAKVRMRAEYNIKERRRLSSVVDEKESLLKVRNAEEKDELDVKVPDLTITVKAVEREVADLDAAVTSVKLQNDNLVDQLETSSVELQEKVTMYENCTSQLEKFQHELMEIVYEKFNKLNADLVEMALHLEEKFYPHMLTTIAGRMWLLTYGLKLAIVKCLHSLEYLSALRTAISKAIEKGMQDGYRGTYGVVPNTNTALSVITISFDITPPISTDDCEVAHADNQEGTGAGSRG
nr:hypothetical protein [Tanacetum cinerariifolium]